MTKVIKNDQAEIIQNLKDGKLGSVWLKVKNVGYKEEPNINNRYIIFNRVVQIFNPYENDNFIHFYKKYLAFLSLTKDETFFLTDNYRIINSLKNENISPKNNLKGIARYIKDWENT